MDIEIESNGALGFSEYLNRQSDKSYLQKYSRLLAQKTLMAEMKDELQKRNKVLGQDKNCRLVKLQLVAKTGSLQDRSTSLQFDYNDLERNLGIFGKIESIYIKQHSVAFVQFEEQVSAVLALKSLQGFTLKEWKDA